MSILRRATEAILNWGFLKPPSTCCGCGRADVKWLIAERGSALNYETYCETCLRLYPALPDQCALRVPEGVYSWGSLDRMAAEAESELWTPLGEIG